MTTTPDGEYCGGQSCRSPTARLEHYPTAPELYKVCCAHNVRAKRREYEMRFTALAELARTVGRDRVAARPGDRGPRRQWSGPPGRRQIGRRPRATIDFLRPFQAMRVAVRCLNLFKHARTWT